MSLFGSFGIGTAGMQAQTTALDVISNNLSNVSTIGYKQSITSFSDLISDNAADNFSVNGNGSSAAGYNPSGVLARTSSRNSLQGTINGTNLSTDLAISGTGFFAVNQSATATASTSNTVYTRAGSFTADDNGNLVNTSGYFLQGWPIDPLTGTVASGLNAASVSASTGIAGLKTVNVQKFSAVPVATTAVSIVANLQSTQSLAPINVSVVANLQSTQAVYSGPPTYDPNNSAANMASGSIAPQFTTPFTLTDSKGTVHNLTIGYLRTVGGQWSVEVYAQPASDVTGANGQVAQGSIDFNVDGSLSGVSPNLQKFSVNWQDGADTTNLAFNWGTQNLTNGISQLNSPYALTSIQVQPYDPTMASTDMASGAAPPNFTSQITLVDSNGGAHQVEAGFLKTGTNTWAVELYAQPATDVTAAGGQLAAGTVTFNGDSTLASVSPSLTQAIAIGWQNGTSSSVTFNWGTAGQVFGTPGATIIGRTDGLSQNAGSFTQNTTANGTQASPLKDISVTKEGLVQATYRNGFVQNIFQIPLANFVNPDQLQSETGGVFTLSHDTAAPNFLQPGQGNAGTIDPAALESSNVDVATQLTELIIAQRAYQSASKISSTTDTMLQDLNTMGTT